MDPSEPEELKVGLPYKTFVLDVDGTICDYDGRLNVEAVHSIRMLRAMGYEVILASGRGPWDTYYLSVFIGCSKVAVCENGGVFMTSPVDMKVFGDKSKSLEAYDLLSRKFPDIRLKPVSARLTEVVLLRTFDSGEGQRVLDENDVPVKINDSKFALHLTSKSIDKSVGLREALRFMSLSSDEAIVIGDSDTDIPMFGLCGYGIAVANASQSVKSAANHSCKREIGDGVVEAISFAAEKLLDKHE